MRRSLGTKPSVLPPKRFRQSQEHEASSRQSRSSFATNAGPSSSSKRVSSSSRLPVPSSAAKKESSMSRVSGTAQKRSSSAGRPGNVLVERSRNTMTPSKARLGMAKPNFTTPKRMSVAPTPSSRLSTIGTASKRMSGRGSHMGARAVKDTRRLQDKDYQREQVKKILDFLRANGYGNTTLTSKNFPLSSKEFANIFNFLYSVLDPGLTTNKIPMVKFEEEVIKTMKGLSYPGNLTKSHLQTMGSLHSYPTVLGVLAYLCDLARIYSEKLLPAIQFNALMFPSRDDNGLPIDRANPRKIEHEFFINCFHKFNNDPDERSAEEMDYSEELEYFKEEMMISKNFNMDQLMALDSKLREKLEENAALKARNTGLQETLEQKDKLSADIVKLEGYREKLLQVINERKAEIEMMPSRQEALFKTRQNLKVEIDDLKVRCANAKTDHLEAQRNAFTITEKRRQIDNIKQESNDLEKTAWELEMKYSKSRESVSAITRQINNLALEADVRAVDGSIFKLEDFKVNQANGYENVKANLVEVVKDAKVENRALEKEVAKAEAVHGDYKDKLESMKKQLHERKMDLKHVIEETLRTKDTITKEEAHLDSRLAEVRNQLLQAKTKEKNGLVKLEEELLVSRSRLDAVKAKRQQELDQGLEFLRKVTEKTVWYFEQCDKIEKAYVNAVKNKLRRNIEEVKRAAMEIEDKCKNCNLE